MKHFRTILFTTFLGLIISGSSFAQFILYSNPGPANNGGSPGWAIFFDLIAGPYYIEVTDMTTASTATAGSGFNVEFFVRQGTALGGPVTGGPGSSTDGWTSLGTVPVTQGAVNSGISLLFATPTISVNSNDTTGVAMLFTGAGPRYFGTGSPPYGTYADSNLTLITGDARSIPFTPTGSWFSSRELVGEIHYDAIVPVEMVSFTASVLQNGNNNAVELSWITATELNNSGFGIERKSANSEWENIGFVNGHGTTTETQYYSFTDNDLGIGSYLYRLKQIDFNGSFDYSDEVTATILSPNNFVLMQNYPNPFNPSTKISFIIPQNSFVSLKVYDVLGNEVADILEKNLAEGNYDIEFNASDLTSGVYYYTLKAGNFVESKKMMLLK